MEGLVSSPPAGESHRPRIAVALEYPLLQHGGTEALVRELIRGLAQRFAVVVVSGDRDRAALGPVFGALVSDHVPWTPGKVSRRAARELARALAARGVKLAHFHSGFSYAWESHKAWQSPLFYVAGAGIPCIVTTHLVQTFLMGFSDPARPAWQRALLLPKAWVSRGIILHRTRVEFMVSKHDQMEFQRFYPAFAGKMERMYHSALMPDDSGDSAGARTKTVLCVGRFCERKGQTFLASAFGAVAPQHPDWSLELMGPQDDAAYVGKVREIVDRLDLSRQVRLLPEGDARPFLKSAAIFAMPSTCEALGLSLQEALYQRCACVGSDVGGIPELIEHEETGLLVPPGDVPALASALDRLMTDADLRTRLGNRARASISEKGMLAPLMIERHARLYADVLSGERW